MKDIARAFGVSVATVSRALDNNPRISEATRTAIQAYARERNFVPNVLGKQLRLVKSSPLRIIGLIVPQINHFYFSSIISGVEEEAYSRGYMVSVAQSNELYERETDICNSFVKNKLDGVIVSQSKATHSYDHFQKLVDRGMPIVFCDRICTGIDASRVVVDDYMGAYNAVCHLIDTGCRRIAFYGSPMTMEISKNRFNGYKDALLRHKLPFDESLVFHCDNRPDAEIITPGVIDRENGPDAFFAINDDTAIGILYTVKRMGLRVPEDVCICGFSNGDGSTSCEPMLTTVEQRGAQVGEEAANILINQIEGLIPKDRVERRVVRTRLIIRGTTR